MAEPATATNQPLPENVQNAVQKIEDLDREKLAEHMAYMSRCREISKSKAVVYDMAKEQGIPKKELRANVKARDLDRKLQAVRADLEADEQPTYDMLKEMLGGLANLPLGNAALAAHASQESLDQLQH